MEVIPNLSRICNQLNKISRLLRNPTCLPEFSVTPSRTTMVVKRRFPVTLYKEGNKPRLRRRTFYYDLVEDTDSNPEQNMDIVLTSYVSGVGNPGDVINMKRTAAYYDFILPGLAGYPTPENLEYSRNMKKDQAVQDKLLTPTEENLIDFLTYEKRRFSIVMNKETEWTIEPWHVVASFRKAGVHILSESAIELPAKPIRGPDMNLEGKEFDVFITINKKHKVKVTCRIHHWSTNLTERLPWEQEYWLNSKGKVFSEDDAGDTSNVEPPKPT